jgi:hypothetical protein
LRDSRALGSILGMVARQEALQHGVARRILEPRRPSADRARVGMAAGASLGIGSLARCGTPLLRTGGGSEQQ